MAGVSVLGGLVIPISVIRSGDKTAITKLRSELASITSSASKANIALSGIGIATSKAQDSFLEYGKERTIATGADKEFVSIQDALKDSMLKSSGAMSTSNIVTRTYIDHFEKAFITTDRQRKALGIYGSAVDDITKKHVTLQSVLKWFTTVRWTIVNIAMLGAVAYGIAKITMATEKTRFEFQRLAITAGTSLGSVRDAIVDLTYKTPESLADITKAYQDIIKSGFTLVETQKILEASTGAALVGFSDLGSTSMAVAQILKQFDIDVSRAMDVSYKLAAAANAGRVDIETLGDALKYSGAIASQVGTSFEEMASTVAILSNKGLEASQIGRGQRQAMLSLLSPTVQATSLMRTYGIDIKSTSGGMKTFTEIIKEFETSLSGLTEASKQDIIGKIFPANAVTIILESMGKTREEIEALTKDLSLMASEKMLDAVDLQVEKAITLAGWWQRVVASSKEYADTIIQVSSKGAEEVGAGYVESLKGEILALAKQAGTLTPELIERVNKLAISRGGEGILTKQFEYIDKINLQRLEGYKESLMETAKASREVANAEAEEVEEKKRQIEENDRLLDSLLRTGIVFNDIAKRTEDYSGSFDIAVSIVARFNEELKGVRDTYGSSIKSQQIMNQLLDDFGGKANEYGPIIGTMFKELASSLVENSSYTNSLREMEDEFRVSIDGAKDALQREQDVLKELNETLSETEKRIGDLSSVRFTGETGTLDIIRKAEVYRKQQELSELGVGDAQQFILEALRMESSEYDTLFAKLSKINSVMETNTDAFDAWQESIKTAIKAEVEAGQELTADVSGRVKTWQTALLGIGGMKGGGQQKTALDDYINKLQLASDVYYGSMHGEVENFLAEQKDRELGVFDTSSQLISALQNEMIVRDSLIAQINTQEEVVSRAEGELDMFNEGLKSVTDSISNYTDTINDSIKKLVEERAKTLEVPTPIKTEITPEQEAGVSAVLGVTDMLGKMAPEELSTEKMTEIIKALEPVQSSIDTIKTSFGEIGLTITDQVIPPISDTLNPALQGTVTNTGDAKTNLDEMSKIDLSDQVSSFSSLATSAKELSQTGIAKELIALQSKQISKEITIEQMNIDLELERIRADLEKYRIKHGGDFISRPGGEMISFNPQDTIIGVKNPSNLMGGGSNDTYNIEINTNTSNPTLLANEIMNQLAIRNTKRALRASGA